MPLPRSVEVTRAASPPFVDALLAARAIASNTYSDEIRCVLAAGKDVFSLRREVTRWWSCGTSLSAPSVSSLTLLPDRRGARTVRSSSVSNA